MNRQAGHRYAVMLILQRLIDFDKCAYLLLFNIQNNLYDNY